MVKKFKIKSIKAREILDSRANWTVEVDLTTEKDFFQASVPSGASKGKYEAVELRDKGKRYHGMGVLKAVNNVNKIIAPKLLGKDPTKQKEIDDLMIKLDGTENKSKLGANAILGVSMAVCRAGAATEGLSLYQYIAQISGIKPYNFVLPTSSFNVINGGAHAGNELDFQEFMIVPREKVFLKALQMTSEIYQELKKIIKKKYLDSAINLGDEGGFAPPIRMPEEALDLILDVSKNLGFQNNIQIILDVAASQFFVGGKYITKMGMFSREDLSKYYLSLIKKYPILGLEDPFSEEDWEGWKVLNSKLQMANSKILIIGDDLLATNQRRIKMAKAKNACNAVIVKINQIGTITEAIEAVKLAKSYNWKTIVSHRSGETNDDFIADLAVGIGADFIKAGAPAKGERVAKYNRLLRIEEELKHF